MAWQKTGLMAWQKTGLMTEGGHQLHISLRGNIVTIVLESFCQNFMLCSLFLQLFHFVSGQHPPSTIFVLLGFPLGITGVKGVNLDPELPS